MPLIPLKQQVTIIKAAPGGVDIYGNPIPGESIVYKCRVDETSERITNQNGQEALSTLQIWLDKYVPVDYTDYIQYTDEAGRTIKRQPIKIEPIRALNSKKVYFTVVYV